MRDVRTGDISAGRDVVIDDRSDQPKLLVQCTNEELLEEEQHRRSILRKEESRLMRFHVPVFVVAGLLLLVAVVWFHVQGDFDMVSLLTGAGGIGLGLLNLKAMEQPSVFEIRQREALEEINMILRERGFR